MSSWAKRKKAFQKRQRRVAKKSAPLTMKTEPRQVAILTPACDMCNTGFAMSLAHMLGETYRAMLTGKIAPIAISVNSYGTSILPFSRQVLAKTALEQGATHQLWIDSDMEFPGDMLLRFLKHTEPIVGINAMSRRKPFRCTAQTGPAEYLRTTPESTGLEKVYRMGFGVVWIASEVFQKIELPWFEFTWMPELSVFRGEDYSFFEKAKALGYECYIDHDISKAVYHNGAFGYNPLLIAQAEASGQLGELSQEKSAAAR